MNIREELQARDCLFLDTGYQFVGVGENHLTGYCNVDPALLDVRFMSAVARKLVEPFLNDEVEAVLVPAVGAIPLAEWAPHHIIEANGGSIPGVWADKLKPPLKGLALERRGFKEAVEDRRVLILEDMINRMYSVGQLIRIAREVGAFVVGVGAIAANSGVNAEILSVPKFNVLCEVTYDTFTPDECRDRGPCAERLPIVTHASLGHGAEYQQKHPNYEGGYIELPERRN